MSATTDSAAGNLPPIPRALDASSAVAAHGAGDASTHPGADGGSSVCGRVSSSLETTPAPAMASGAFSRKGRGGHRDVWPLEKRLEVAHAMKAAMERDDLTIGEAGRLVGVKSQTHAHKIAKLIGLRSSASALYRARLSCLAPTAQANAQRAKERDDKIRQLHAQGYSQTAIARKLGMDRKRVSFALNRGEPASGKTNRKELAAKFAEMMQRENLTRAETARRLGIGQGAAKRLAADFGLKASPEAVQAAKLAAWHEAKRRFAKRMAARPKAPRVLPSRPQQPKVTTAPAPPNPKMSSAQQANLDKLKSGYWRAGNGRVAPPSAEDAARAIAEYLATRSVTRCPTMALLPINNGTGR